MIYGTKAYQKRVCDDLASRGIPYEEENRKVEYLDPTTHTYTPDIELPNGILIEVKGFFQGKDRVKHLRVQQQHTELDIRFIFQNPKNKIVKGRPTTYAMWCDKHGFKWAEKLIPQEWIDEGKERKKSGTLPIKKKN